VKRWLFDRFLKSNLIYNQCWEDPSIDKQALNLTAADRIVTITSAGCNALDYLLSAPQRIDCVDVNPHQTAPLELKVAAIRVLPHGTFFKMFGRGRLEGHRRTYERRLRPFLSACR
jgi:S-adenosylmethionine-diacylglycerol 3-amino-3-carboxypropyl transferase